MTRFFSSLVFLCLVEVMLYGQVLTFDHITIDDGLSNNTVYCIAQDADGFLWLGTRDGLNRYDGYEFRVFKADTYDANSLPANIVQALFVHKSGDIWVGLRRGGIVIFRRETQTFEALDVQIDSVQSIAEVAIEAFFEDSSGDIWVGTAGLGVIQLDQNGRFKSQYASFVSDTAKRLLTNNCFSFTEDPAGDIWFATNGDAVHCYSRNTGEIRVVRQANGDLYSYRKFVLTKGDTLFIGTEGNGVFSYDIPTNTFRAHHLPGKLVRDLILRDQELYISTDGDGLFTFNINTEEIANHRFSNSLRSSLNTNALYDIFTDRDGNIWIGSFNGGINVLKARGVPLYSYVLGPQSVQTTGAFSVLCFHEEKDGRILVGMDGAGIWEFTPNAPNNLMSPYQTRVPESVTGQVITALFRDSKGVLWIGTFAHGLIRVDANGLSYQAYVYKPEEDGTITNNNIWDITEDQQGNIWIAALGGGVMRYDRTSDRFVRYIPDPDDPGSLSDWNARVVFVDRNNRVWVGTEDGGLNQFDRENGDFRIWSHQPEDTTGLHANTILCIFEAADGGIWVGTEGGGLHLLDEQTGTFKQYAIRDGLQSNVINAIEEDAQGRLWISSNDGISLLNVETGAITNFDSNDGLSSDQFNPNASIHSSGGELIFGNISGVNGLVPSQVQLNQNLPEVVFTDFQLFNNPVAIGPVEGKQIIDAPLNDDARISLLYRENVFTIAFAAIEYTNPRKNQYAYRMLGFEDDWNYVNAETRRATYTNLNPGDYIFEVRASNNNGVWSDQVRSLQITIAPPFYATTWFRLSVVLLFLAVLIGVIKFRDARRKQRHEQELLVAEQKILQLRNANLADEVRQKNAELSAALLQSAHKNKALDGLKAQLSTLSGDRGIDGDKRHELGRLMRKIESEIEGVDYWERFQLNFNEVHQEFAEKIHITHPNLTQNDIRLCCLLKINLTNREIAAIQNISVGGVEKSKFRLKRKLNLEGESDLNAYILGFS